MEQDPCHELEMARAALAQVGRQWRRMNADSFGDVDRLSNLLAALRAEIRWWQPRCEQQLRKEEGDAG